jgi:hypothetical protein
LQRSPPCFGAARRTARCSPALGRRDGGGGLGHGKERNEALDRRLVGVGVDRRVGFISGPAGGCDLIVRHLDPKAILAQS